MDGDLEMQQGYLRRFGGPKGVKLKRGPSDASGRVLQWLSDSGQTTMKQMAAKWGVEPEQVQKNCYRAFSRCWWPKGSWRRCS